MDMVGIATSNTHPELGDSQKSVVSGYQTNGAVRVSQLLNISCKNVIKANKDHTVSTSSAVAPKYGTLASQFLNAAEKLVSGQLRSSAVHGKGKVIIEVKHELSPVRPSTSQHPVTTPRPPERATQTARSFRNAVSQVMEEAEKRMAESKHKSFVCSTVVNKNEEQAPVTRGLSSPRVPTTQVRVSCVLDKKDVERTKGHVSSNVRSLQEHLKAYFSCSDENEGSVLDEICRHVPKTVVIRKAIKRQNNNPTSGPASKVARRASEIRVINYKHKEFPTACKSVPVKGDVPIAGMKEMIPVARNILFDKDYGPYVLEWFKTHYNRDNRLGVFSCAACTFQTVVSSVFWLHVEMHLKI